MSRRASLIGRTALLGTLMLGLSGCAVVDWFGGDDEPLDPTVTERQNITGQAGMNAAAAPGARVGVNAYLWRAALDTVAFMPVTQADPFGGVVVTDWYSPPASPDERFKVNLYILDQALRADGVRVGVFRQVRSPAGWMDAAVAPETQTQLEDAILTRARQLRQSAAGAQ